MAAVQLRIDGVKGYGLPLKPQVLADLSDLEIDYILTCLDLDGDQRACAENAIAAVRSGTYGEAGQ